VLFLFPIRLSKRFVMGMERPIIVGRFGKSLVDLLMIGKRIARFNV